MSRTGAQLMLDILAEFGVRHLFGNPGTTEMPLMDALAGQAERSQNSVRYILGLQEVPVVAAADGYAQASRSLGVVNLHTCCGLGNAMGMIYNAWSAGTPLLITAGQQDRRLLFSDPVLAGDMVSVARPWTRYAAEVNRIEDLPSALRRAIQAALTPPTGPVFLSLPIDLQAELTEITAAPPTRPDETFTPPAKAVSQAAKILDGAKNPLILAGHRVLARGATQHVVELAERLGAAVLTDPPSSHARMGFPCDHPLFAGWLSHYARDVAARLAGHDFVLAVGIELLREYIYLDDTPAVPSSVRLIQIDDDPTQLGKNYPPEIALQGDMGLTCEVLSGMLSPFDASRQTLGEIVAERVRAAKKIHDEARQRLRKEIATASTPASSGTRISPAALMGAIADTLPEDVAVVEEAATTTGAILQRLGAIRRADGYFGHTGWALGWGLNSAVGVSLAWPDRPVLAILGDGGSLYGIQGLWTAAKENLPVTFLIANNQSYEILKHGARKLGLPHASAGQFVGLDLTQPAIDYVALAQSFGVAAVRASTLDEVRAILSDRLTTGIQSQSPQLIEVPIADAAHGP